MRFSASATIGELAGLVPVGLGSSNPPVSLGAGPVNRRVPVRLRRSGGPMGLLHGSVTSNVCYY